MLTRRTWLRNVTLASVAAATGFAGRATRAAEPIRIGWLSSLTGPLSAAAIAENQGVQFAVDEVNKKGGTLGRPLELVTRDTAGDPTKAVNFAQQLVFREKVDFLVGPVNSGESLATVPIVAKAGLPNLIIGTIDELVDPQKFPRAFRVINTNTQWIKSANNYAIVVMGRKKPAIIGDTSGYGTASAKVAESYLQQLDVKPVYTALIDANKADLTDEISKAREAGADVLMHWSAATGLLARMLNTRASLAWDVPVVGHPAILSSTVPPLLNRPENLENVYAAGYRSTTFRPDGTLPPRTQALMEALRPQFGGKIDLLFWWVALGYDVVHVVDYAITKAGSTDPAKIQEVLEATDRLEGAFATYSWSPTNRNGFPDGDIVMVRGNTFDEGCFQPAPT
jgi:branched-chain amino acid transport system substrate-binding protein